MCHIVKCMLEDKQLSLIIRISASIQEADTVLTLVTQDLSSTVAPTSHLQATLAHLAILMETRTPTILMI